MAGCWAGALLVCAIELLGVRGNALRARAFFDANNVKVGDPLVLTVDFIGDADFSSLHPPALAKAVDRADWKVDDASAKTDTFRDARRLTYRVRPMREGLLWFPSLEFAYEKPSGATASVRANAIPVHAKAGQGVVVAGMDEADEAERLPAPPDLVADAGVPLADDARFAWRKACAAPTAAAFAAFDFPAARLNEASCAVREGNWARALSVYRALEWRTGQTPEIEKGIRAALALRFDSPDAELPVWRQVLRPLLRFAWAGRVGLVLGGLLATALLFWLLGRGIRALACVALALGLAVPAQADVFEQMEEQMRQMRQRMNRAFGGGLFGGLAEAREPVRIAASVETDRDALRVGEPFAFVVLVEAPKTATLDQLRLGPKQTFGLTVTGPVESLADLAAANPSNVIRRFSVPARYDVPFKGGVAFAVQGMVTGRETSPDGRRTFSFSNSFDCETEPLAVDVQPLEAAGQPADFAGIVSEGLRLHETCDVLTVETNDVVTVSYRLVPNGYVPDDFLLPGAAFEWTRQRDRAGRTTEIEYRRFVVADGAPATPKVSVSYYDPRTKSYRRATAGGTLLTYM